MKRSRMRKRSKKMEEFYDKVRRPAVAEAVGQGRNPCQIKSPMCSLYVEGIHEKLSRGRGGGIRTVHYKENLVPCCHRCNEYVSSHPAWAEKEGWLLKGGPRANNKQE